MIAPYTLKIKCKCTEQIYACFDQQLIIFLREQKICLLQLIAQADIKN